MHLNSYLLFNGECEEAFRFYAKCLGGKIVDMMPHEGTPAAGQVPTEWLKKILHARMTVGDVAPSADDSLGAEAVSGGTGPPMSMWWSTA